MALELFNRGVKSGLYTNQIYWSLHQRVSANSADNITLIDLGGLPGSGGKTRIMAEIQSEVSTNPEYGRLAFSTDALFHPTETQQALEKTPLSMLVPKKVRLWNVSTQGEINGIFDLARGQENARTLEGVYDALHLIPLLGTAAQIVDTVDDAQRNGVGWKTGVRVGFIGLSLAGDVAVVGRLGSLAKGVGSGGEASSKWTSGLSGAARNASRAFDFRGSGLIDRSSDRFTRLIDWLNRRYGVTVDWTEEVSFGKIDELTKTLQLNPQTASWDVLAHEISHIRFAYRLGKWGTGQKLTDFELNLMEAIGYWQTFRKGSSLGLPPDQVLMDTYLGPRYAQGANTSLLRNRPIDPGVLNSYRKAIDVYGEDLIKKALGFDMLTELRSRDGISIGSIVSNDSGSMVIGVGVKADKAGKVQWP